jgi:hypothetical protein
LETLSQPLFLYYTDYKEVAFVLTHPLYTESFLLPLNQLPLDFSPTISLDTIQEHLHRFGDRTLPTQPNTLPLGATYATFVDAHQAHFNVDPTSTVFHHEVPLPRQQKPDLRLTRVINGTHCNYEHLFNTSLMTVNGLFHQTNYTGDSVNILEGACSAQHANRYQVGVYLFEPLGTVYTVPIRNRHIDRLHPERPLADCVHLSVDERVGSLEGKSLLLSIGGYLHLIDQQLITRHNHRSVLVDFKNYPWLARFQEMDRLLNLYCFRHLIDRNTHNPTQVGVESLYSDAAIRALFCMTQSFFIVVDTPEVFLDKQPLERTELAGRYITYSKPQYPLVAGLNKVYEYWTRYEYDRYVLSIDAPFMPLNLIDTIDPTTALSVDASREPMRIKQHTQAFFWKLGKPVVNS